MINRWTMKLCINNLTIQISSLNYNNTYTKDSKEWNVLLLSFSLFNWNQSFKDNSNSIKPNKYIHMNIKNSQKKKNNNNNNNLQKTLPNIVTIFFPKLCVFLVLFTFMFHQTFSNWHLSYMLTLNMIRKLYIPFVLKAL